MSTTDMYSLAPLQVRERAITDNVLIWLHHREYIVNILIGHKYYVRHLDFEIFLADQAVLQMSQISRSCVIVSMSY